MKQYLKLFAYIEFDKIENIWGPIFLLADGQCY